MKAPAIAAIFIATAITNASAAIPGAEALATLITKQFDTNSDSLIDAGEWQSGIAESFDKLDTNVDGSITANEVDGLQDMISGEVGGVAGTVVTALIKQVIMSLDANGDKAVSRKEFTERSADVFKKLDADSNGALSQEELAALPVKLLTTK